MTGKGMNEWKKEYVNDQKKKYLNDWKWECEKVYEKNVNDYMHNCGTYIKNYIHRNNILVPIGYFNYYIQKMTL